MPTPTSPTMLPTSPAPVTPTNPLNAKPTDTTYAAYEASQGFPQATKPADVTAIQPNQNNGSTSPTPQQQKANSNPQGTTVSNPYGAAGTSPQYTDSNGNPYYMQGNTLVYGTIPGSSPSSAGLPGTTSTGNPNVDALNASYKAQADAATKFANAVTGIENGSIPLNAGEQAQIDGLKQQFQALIDKQNLVNTSNTNTAWTRGYASGASEYSPTYQANIIGDVITSGQNQVANLMTQEASAVASLTESLQNNDIANLKTAYDAYTAAAEATQKGIQAVIADTQDAMKSAAINSVIRSGITDPKAILAELQKEGYKDISAKDISDTLNNLSPDAQDIYKTAQTAAANGASPDVVAKIMASTDKASALTAAGIYSSTLIPDLQKQAKANGAPQSVIDAIGKATDTTSAFSAAGDYLQTATGDLALYLQYKRDAEANNQVPQDFQTWDAAYQKQQDQEKISTAYGTAYATESAKQAADAKYTGSEATSPVTASTGVASGLTFNAPASIAPYVSFSANGVKYVDLSSFAGTPTEKNQAVQDAQNAGYRVITNKNTALDVQNITDATQKLQDIKSAFDGITADSATERDSYYAAAITMAKELQTDPNAAASGVFQDAALDILKAMSGVQGFRGGASMVEAVQSTFPSNTDTKAVADQKIANISKLIGDRETALVGKPSASDQALIDANNADTTVQNGLTKIKTSNPTLYNAASSMYTAVNPDTGQPYSAADILQAFPELNQ